MKSLWLVAGQRFANQCLACGRFLFPEARTAKIRCKSLRTRRLQKLLLRSHLATVVIAISTATLLPVRPGWAFGEDGHAVVADVARLQLNSTVEGRQVMRRVNQILGLSASAEAVRGWEKAAVWADDIRPRRRRGGDSPERLSRDGQREPRQLHRAK